MKRIFTTLNLALVLSFGGLIAGASSTLAGQGKLIQEILVSRTTGQRVEELRLVKLREGQRLSFVAEKKVDGQSVKKTIMKEASFIIANQLTREFLSQKANGKVDGKKVDGKNDAKKGPQCENAFQISYRDGEEARKTQGCFKLENDRFNAYYFDLNRLIYNESPMVYW